jgi:tetratricopeptide (TPR) repeat protein
MGRKKGFRPSRSRWQVAVTAAVIVIAGGAAAVSRWPHARWWLIPATAAAAAMTPPVLSAAARTAQRRRDATRVVRTRLQGTTGRSSALPVARQADLEARVHQTVLAIPYIHRDQEEGIRKHLDARRPVLLVGTSMLGKTKMAARVITDRFGSWPVVIPDSKSALGELDAADMSPQRSVVWLDDLDRLIRPGGITDGLLRRLADAGNVIIATIRIAEYERFQPTNQLRPPEWDAISVFERIFLSRELTKREQERLDKAIADPDIRAQIRKVGLGEYVGAAGRITEVLKLAASTAGSSGYALVLGAADWYRCGLTRPVPASLLPALAEPHLDGQVRSRLSEHDAYGPGLAWATRDINPNVALLQPAGNETYQVYDYALDVIAGYKSPIADATWNVVIGHADAAELASIALTAQLTHGRRDVGAQAYRVAAASGDVNVAPMAARWLGDMLRSDGDIDGAQAVYQQAINSGHPEHAPGAAHCLGGMLLDNGDVAGAQAAWQQAINSGHPEHASYAAFDLAELLERLGDTDGAQAAWQHAINCGNADLAPWGTLFLGRLLQRLGDTDGAKAAYQEAIKSGQIQIVLKARAAWQQAIDAGRTGISR